MRRLLSGLGFNQGTKPGFQKTTEKFGVCFEGIECENAEHAENWANNVKIKFETCYNWSQIIELTLGSLESFYDDASDFEDDLQDEIKDWLASVDGWGLLFTLLPFELQQYFLLMYYHINMNHQEDNISNEDMFYRIKAMYESETQGLPFSDLIPRVEVKLLQIIRGPKEHERRKMLLIKFNGSNIKLIAKFSVDKKRLRRTLAEIAAEVVGQIVEDSEDLEIPETLKEIVSDKIVDADWVADYWLAKFLKSRLLKSRRLNEEKSKRMNSSENYEKLDDCDLLDDRMDDTIEECLVNAVNDDDNVKEAASSGVLATCNARVLNRVKRMVSRLRS
eukprot:GFUD01028558.1.p1 GENE.GFUD01028558.1~~GFUD01028558.1.p1  ORF type:complete len:334 (+),score=81.17 GFUD01028558.1:31-1032(+)